ncbi:hypothetical protein BCV70DRAFT_215088 [Testicularia cyperi]|uniref:Uncharacterized protein n=1 Tax=Testicularia cyperi TaxID=1882483 RepID=A0A317XZJ5_9BASI|nr:hypothetical protein BCV70DRAFT_215088 [Testicularia cyperi]
MSGDRYDKGWRLERFQYNNGFPNASFRPHLEIPAFVSQQDCDTRQIILDALYGDPRRLQDASFKQELVERVKASSLRHSQEISTRVSDSKLQKGTINLASLTGKQQQASGRTNTRSNSESESSESEMWARTSSDDNEDDGSGPEHQPASNEKQTTSTGSDLFPARSVVEAVSESVSRQLSTGKHGKLVVAPGSWHPSSLIASSIFVEEYIRALEGTAASYTSIARSTQSRTSPSTSRSDD